jgi:hypothetical protein
MSEASTIEISTASFDCRASDTGWRYGLYLDPEARTVRHWEHYGNGIPERVFHSRAVITDLPRNGVGTEIAGILATDEFRDLVAALFDLYQGTVWDGNNHVGQWHGSEEDESRRFDLEDEIAALFEDVPTYWDADEWMACSWNPSEANNVRRRLAGGETLEDIAADIASDALVDRAHLSADELCATLSDLLAAFPEDTDDEEEEA